MVLCHHSEHLTYSRVGMNGDRIIYHSVLRPLHAAHLIHLFLDGHVLVDHADTAGTGHGDGEFSLCHSVHCGRYDRGLESDVSRELGRYIHTSRKHLRMCRNQQYVVEGQAFNNRRVSKCLHHDVSKIWQM